MASVALKSLLDGLRAKFESAGGGKVTIVYGLAAQLKCASGVVKQVI